MSRSIHTTRSTWKRVRRQHWSDAEAQQRRLTEIFGELEHKRAYKRNAAVHRQEKPEEPGIPSLPPIEVEPLPEPALHAASQDDVGAILNRFPDAMVAQIAKVQLLLGSDLQAECGAEEECDPYLGRRGVCLAPGVYAGIIQGRYLPSSGIIQLFAYVRHPDIPHRAQWDSLLRLMALSTLVHEIAHHHDAWTAKGKLRASHPDRVEPYADTLQARWIRTLVVPYLREAYPHETALLDEWVHSKTGATVPLELLAADLHWKPGGTVKRAFMGGVFFGFMDLFERKSSRGDSRAAKLWFARNCYFGDAFDVALAVVEGLLSESPDDGEALVLKAEILSNEKRYEEAEALLRPLASHSRTDTEAQRLLIDLLAKQERHREVVTLADTLLQGLEESERASHLAMDLMLSKVPALLALGRTDELAPLLETLGRSLYSHVRRDVATWRTLLLVEGGHLEIALRRARRLLVDRRRRLTPALRVVELLCRRGLGKGEKDARLGERENSFLEEHGLRTWFEARLR